ncbi:MAG: polysaccharide biosynthesis protein [Paracoccaceae bacterium]
MNRQVLERETETVTAGTAVVSRCPAAPCGFGRVLLCGSGYDAQAVHAGLAGMPGTQVVAAVALPGQAPPAGLPTVPLAEAAASAMRLRAGTAILAGPEFTGQQLAELARRFSALGLGVFGCPAHVGLVDPAGAATRLYPLAPARRRLPGRPGEEAYGGESVMVTGAGGTIGRELCRTLAALGPRRLVLFDASELALDQTLRELRLRTAGLPVELTAVLGSVGDAGTVGRAIRRNAVDTILHAAAYKHVAIAEEQPEAVFRNNTLGTAVLAGRAHDEGVARFVLISTDKAVRPGGLMGASKRLAEIVVQDLARRPGRTVFSIVRFGNVIGSSGSVVPRFAEQIALGGPVTVTDPGVTRYFMTAEDAAELVLSAGRFARGGEFLVLDMGQPLRILDIAERMIRASGRRDLPVVTTGLLPGEKLHEEISLAPGTPLAPAGPLSRILSVREPSPPPLAVAAMLRDLRDALDSGSGEGLARLASRWVGHESVPFAVPARMSGL